MARNEVCILGATSAAHLLCHLSVLIVTGLFVPLQEEFNLNEFWVTVLPLVGLILMGVGAVPAGLITDRRGARLLLIVFFAALSLSCAGAALAQNAWTFAAALRNLSSSCFCSCPCLT